MNVESKSTEHVASQAYETLLPKHCHSLGPLEGAPNIFSEYHILRRDCGSSRRIIDLGQNMQRRVLFKNGCFPNFQ